MDKSNKVATLYIATLKAMALIHQHSHWTTRGIAFYGDHLLFERLYNSALKDLDLAAEKFIGLFGDQVLNYDIQAELLYKVLLKYKDLEGSPLEMSLGVEKDFLKFSQDAYNTFEDDTQLTLGLDDMIMAIASQREESVYLLQQALKGNVQKVAQQNSDQNRVMENKIKNTFQKLLPNFKITNIRIDGMNSKYPEAHIEGQGAQPNQIKNIATEIFLMDNRVPTIYFNGQALSVPAKI